MKISPIMESSLKEEDRRSREMTLSIVSHCVSLLAIAIPAIVLHSGVKPFNRLFYCNDESISYPFKEDTIAFYVAIAGGAIVALLTVLVVEAIRVAAGQTLTKRSITERMERCNCMSEKSAGYLTGVLIAIYLLLFGAICTELVTQSAKLGFGRHRPYFLSTCQLNATCIAGRLYQVSDCSSTVNSRALQQAQVSFPSGHSSYSMFIATFLALYLQSRLGFRHQFHSVKNVCQLALLILGGYVCLSRVSDYHHHWSDILCGGLLGVGFGVLMYFKLAHNPSPAIKHPQQKSDEEIP